MAQGKRNYQTKTRSDGTPEKYRAGSQELEVIKEQVANYLRTGKRSAWVVEYLMNTFGFSKDRAYFITKTVKADIRQHYDDYCAKVAEHNINVLLAVIDDAFNTGDNASVISAVDKLNKIAGLYKEKLEVDSNQPLIKLSFG